MKIGILCYATYGGSGVVATELGRAMAHRGHEVHFINHMLPVRLEGEFSNEIFFHQVTVPNYPLFAYPPWSMALTGRVVQVIKEHGLDVLHAHYAVPHSLVAVLARQIAGQVGVVTTLHGTDITLVGSEPDFLEVTRYAIENSDAVTAVSQALAQESRERFALSIPVHTVYNFVDLDHYRRQVDSPRSLYARPEQAVLIHISNFRHVKPGVPSAACRPAPGGGWPSALPRCRTGPATGGGRGCQISGAASGYSVVALGQRCPAPPFGKGELWPGSLGGHGLWCAGGG